MGYRFKLGRSVDSDVRRIADKQLQLAIDGMRRRGDRESDSAVNGARRHIQKVRALIRLVQPGLGRASRSADRQLWAVKRLLAPIANGEAMVDMVARLRQQHSRTAGTSTRSWRCAEGLSSVQQESTGWLPTTLCWSAAYEFSARSAGAFRSGGFAAHGFRAVAAGLERTVRAARRARARAIAHPTIGNYHTWRRRVKDHWLQVRLLEGRCGDELMAWQQGLEALDGCLGEHHNCVLLQQVLVSTVLLPRHESADILRLLRRYQRTLRRDAHNLAAQLYVETPRQVVRRVRRLWRIAREAGPATKARASWARAA